MVAPLKLMLFVDAQNVYQCARDVLLPGVKHHTDGQIDPWAAAELIADRSGPHGEPVEVVGVRVYTGYHTPDRNPRSYSAYRRQRAFWEQRGCQVIERALRYLGPRDTRGREKGIDVALAVDYVRMAIQRDFEIGVIFSADSDLSPALEFVKDRNDPCLIPATAAWFDGIVVRQINVPGVWCHHLEFADYMAVHDTTNYAPR